MLSLVVALWLQKSKEDEYPRGPIAAVRNHPSAEVGGHDNRVGGLLSVISWVVVVTGVGLRLRGARGVFLSRGLLPFHWAGGGGGGGLGQHNFGFFENTSVILYDNLI